MRAHRELLETAGKRIESLFEGSMTSVTEPADQDRPWVVHAYNVDGSDLQRAGDVLADLILDVEEAHHSLDAVGICHSTKATRAHYRDEVTRILLDRAARKISPESTAVGVCGTATGSAPMTWIASTLEWTGSVAELKITSSLVSVKYAVRSSDQVRTWIGVAPACARAA